MLIKSHSHGENIMVYGNITVGTFGSKPAEWKTENRC